MISRGLVLLECQENTRALLHHILSAQTQNVADQRPYLPRPLTIPLPTVAAGRHGCARSLLLLLRHSNKSGTDNARWEYAHLFNAGTAPATWMISDQFGSPSNCSLDIH